MQLKTVQYLVLCSGQHNATHLVEAQWLYKDYTPTLEEYLNNASVAIGCSLALAHAYAFIIQQMTKEDIDGIDKYLKLIALTSLIFRLFDDLNRI
ncbi:hypothetical protein ACLOJK_038072 [Asimina triloba]